MGHGSYSIKNAVLNSTTAGSTYGHKKAGVLRATMDIGETFKQRSINNAMSPHGITVRESRDSEDNPNSFPFIVALDETASMGMIPHYLCSEGLVKIMEKVIDGGQKQSQCLFLGVGDHECDRAPLQVGQFETSDELVDKWLTSVYLERGGGGNGGESYLLPWYFAAKHTSTDSWEKRKKKGVLFTIGDEPTLKKLPGKVIKGLMGCAEAKDWSHVELLNEARKTYEVYHIHVTETVSGGRKFVQDGWKELMGDNVLFADNTQDISTFIADKVLLHSDVSEPTIVAEKTEDDVVL